jgi:ferritin-like metal-binding protein YciE
MASIDSMNALLVDELRDIYDAEKRLTKAIPKMAKKAENEELRSALEEHLQETQGQIARLEEAFEHLGEKAKGKPCAGMRGIIEEGEEHMSEDYEDDDLRDAVIIGSAQRVEHYEIAAYGTAIAHARLLEQEEIVRLLEETLEEEKATDARLTEIAESVVNLEAADQDEGEEGEDVMMMPGGERAACHGSRVVAARRCVRRPEVERWTKVERWPELERPFGPGALTRAR